MDMGLSKNPWDENEHHFNISAMSKIYIVCFYLEEDLCEFMCTRGAACRNRRISAKAETKRLNSTASLDLMYLSINHFWTRFIPLKMSLRSVCVARSASIQTFTSLHESVSVSADKYRNSWECEYRWFVCDLIHLDSHFSVAAAVIDARARVHRIRLRCDCMTYVVGASVCWEMKSKC